MSDRQLNSCGDVVFCWPEPVSSEEVMKVLALTAFLNLVIAFTGLTMASDCQAEPPTVDEVLAVHRQNLERLHSLHLQATITTEWTEAFRSSHRQKAQQVEKMIELLESGELTIEDVSPQLAQSGYTVPLLISTLKDELEAAQALANNTQFQERVEVFISGNDYQVRTPIRSSDYDESNWQFPKTDISPESLRSDYDAMRIYSRSQTLDPKARVWCGAASSTGSPQTALMMDGHFNESWSMALPPYLSVVQARWEKRHPMENFWKESVSEPTQQYHIVREEVVDDRTLVVVDALVRHDHFSSKLVGTVGPDEDGNTVEYFGYDFYRGWLDMSRGAVPVKLERWYGSVEMDREQTAATQPRDTLTTNRIEKLESGAYYPAVTVLDKYKPVVSEDQKEVLGYEVHERKTWDCTRVASPKSLPESFFVLDFPKGQDFYDMEERKVVGALEPNPPVRPGTLAPPLTGATWVDGHERSLEEFRGQVVVIDFWGFWCGGCIRSIPALKEVQEHYRDQPVTFVAIHTAETFPDELSKRIQQFAEEENWQFLHAIDSGTASHNSKIANAYGISGYPSNVIIAPDGFVSYNSEVPPPGLEDIIGKPCDEGTPEDLARMQAYLREELEAAGIEVPDFDALTEEEQVHLMYQFHVHQLKRHINAALKPADDR